MAGESAAAAVAWASGQEVESASAGQALAEQGSALAVEVAPVSAGQALAPAARLWEAALGARSAWALEPPLPALPPRLSDLPLKMTPHPAPWLPRAGRYPGSPRGRRPRPVAPPLARPAPDQRQGLASRSQVQQERTHRGLTAPQLGSPSQPIGQRKGRLPGAGTSRLSGGRHRWTAAGPARPRNALLGDRAGPGGWSSP